MDEERFQMWSTSESIFRGRRCPPSPEVATGRPPVAIATRQAPTTTSGLFASHPLQVRTGRNQLQPLLVTMPNRKLLHSRRARSTSGAASHAIRARRCALLHFQVWEFSDEASIGAVPRLKPCNLFLTLFPVHSVVLDSRCSLNQVSTMCPRASGEE